MNPKRTVWLAPTAAVAVVAVALIVWLRGGPGRELRLRVPGTDQPPGEGGAQANVNPVLRGTVVPGSGTAADLAGAWPQFRGPDRNGIPATPVNLLREWPGGSPRQLWSVDLGEGYAGPVVAHGRVYVMDYDREKRRDALRCLSLADGKEIWRFTYPVPVKRNHGMSRTIPAVSSNLVVAMGPKCHVACVDATTGELRWGLDLVRQFGATVPPWYTGQCPLVDEDKVVLAPGGREALLLAVDAATGNVVWKTPNPRGWKMTHSSVMPMEFGGRRMYVYCASGGVVGVSARDGSLLWETSDWKISIATVPSPLPLDQGRVFLSGGYNAGSLMLQLTPDGDRFRVQTLFRLKPEIFGATQHTPVYTHGRIYGVRPDGELVCLDLDGKVVWNSGPKARFGLGPFLMAGDLGFAMDDSGRLTLFEGGPTGWRSLAQAQVLQGGEAWAPLALAGGRLLARDVTRMVCLEVGTGQ